MTEEQPPDKPERRKGYKELEKQLNQHVDELTNRLQGFLIKSLLAFTVLGMTSALSLLGFSIVLKEQGQQARDIQQQRYDTLMLNCLEQNQRHDRAQKRAEELLPLESISNVAKLIAELQPREPNCIDYVEERVKGLYR